MLSRLTISLVLFMLFSVASAKQQPNERGFQAVLHQFLNDQPVLALRLAEDCAAQDMFCAKFVESQLWFLRALPDENERLDELNTPHKKQWEKALRSKQPEAVAMEVWIRANQIPADTPEWDNALAELDSALTQDSAFAWYIAGELRSLRQNRLASRDGLNYFIRASELGAPSAMLKVAQILACRDCPGEYDDTAAYDWLQQAVTLGYAPALTLMGEWFREGYVFNKDVSQAEIYLKQAIEKGDDNAYCHLGKMALHGDGMKVDRTVASEHFKKGTEEYGRDCVYFLGEAYDQKWLRSADTKEDDRYFEQCAHQGQLRCLLAWAQENLRNESIAPDENLGIRLMLPLTTTLRVANNELGDYYGYRDEPGSSRLAFKHYQQSIKLNSKYAFKQLVPMMVDHEDSFTVDEMSEIDNYIDQTLQTGNMGLSFTLAMFYARGHYFDRNESEATKWGWGAAIISNNGDRKRLLTAFEKESSFVDDEALKWMIRDLIGEETSDLARVNHYIHQINNGHHRQQSNAVNQLENYQSKNQYADRAKYGLALAYSNKDGDYWDKELFISTATALIGSQDISSEEYYLLGKRAHLDSSGIGDHQLAKRLLDRGGEAAAGLLTRLKARDQYGMQDPVAVEKLLVQLASDKDTSFNTSFYIELANYASQPKYKVNRIDLAETFLQTAILEGDKTAHDRLFNASDSLKMTYGDGYRDYLIEQLQKLEGKSDLIAMQELTLAYRLSNLDANDSEALSIAVGHLRALSDHEHNIVSALAHQQLAWLYGIDNSFLDYDPLQQREHLLKCVDQPICRADTIAQLMENLVMYEPIKKEQASSLIEQTKGVNSNGQSDLVRYYALINDVEGWKNAITESSDYKRDPIFGIYMIYTSDFNDIPRDFFWSLMFEVKKPVASWDFMVSALLRKPELAPSSEAEINHVQFLLGQSDIGKE